MRVYREKYRQFAKRLVILRNASQTLLWNHWWKSLAMSFSALDFHVNINVLEYVTYWNSFKAMFFWKHIIMSYLDICSQNRHAHLLYYISTLDIHWLFNLQTCRLGELESWLSLCVSSLWWTMGTCLVCFPAFGFIRGQGLELFATLISGIENGSQKSPKFCKHTKT